MRRSRSILLAVILASAFGVLVSNCGSDKSSEPDTTAPSAVTDLAIASAGCEILTLTWTAPGDDGSEGRAASYDVRRSTAGITEGNWASATELTDEPAPKPAGSAETLAVSGLTAGVTYYFAVKTTDDSGNESAISNVCSSAGATTIAWVNDGLAADEDWSASSSTLSANWAAASCAEHYEYAIGTTAGAADVIAWTAAGTAHSVTRSGLALADGETYYFSVRSVAGTTTGSPTSSDGITVDTTPPSSSVSELPLEETTATFTVSWTGSDATSGVASYDVQVRTGLEGGWGLWLTGTTGTSADFLGLNGRTYYFRSRARDNAGNVEAYPDLPDAYTVVNLSGNPVVAWVKDGLGLDKEWGNSASQLSGNWAEASGGDGYEYAIGTSPLGTDVLGWTSAGTELHQTHTGLSLVEGETYYFSVRVVVGDARGSAVSSDGITIDLTLPTSAVSPLPAVTANETFVISWTGYDALSGISGYNIEFRDGDGDWEDFLGWTTATSANFHGEDGHTYYFRSQAGDNAGNMEAFPGVPDAQTTVTLPVIPDIAWVHDGLGADEYWTNAYFTTTGERGLSANWAAAPGVDGYDYAIGTAPGDTTFIGWEYAGEDTFLTIWETEIAEGNTYYFSVRGVIGAHHGNPTCSDGATVDMTRPTSEVDSLLPETNTLTFDVSWSGQDALSRVKSYTISVKDGGGDYQDWLVGTPLTSANFTGEDGHTYYFQSQATDSAGNEEAVHDHADASTTVRCEYVFVRRWGSTGTGPLGLDAPIAVEVDAAGDVWVADTDNGRVQKFSPDGDFLMQLGSLGSGDGEFARPSDVAFDDSGYVYVSDRTEHRIQKFTSGGIFVRKWGTYGDGEGELSSPHAIDIDDSGYVYVADTGNERVQKFNSRGEFVKAWGDSGSGAGQFLNPRGIAVGRSGVVYVSDVDNRNIQKFNSNGFRLGGWGCSGSADGCLNMPYKIAIDRSGFVLVADLGNHRIQKFTSSGVFVDKFGTFGTEDGKLDFPSGVAAGDSGTVYTTEHMLDRVQKFRWSCP